jgi:PhnB protein
MAIQVYINFNGNCREAVEFYADVFGTESKIMSFGEAPPNPEYVLPEAAKDLIMHAELNINGSRVMFSDVFPGMSFVQGNNISLTIVSENIEDVKTYFNKLKEGGSVDMELQETFWSKCYGSVTDKFGISWQLSYDNGQH